MNSPSNCEVYYDCSVDCVQMDWDADPVAPSYYEVQRGVGEVWEILDANLSSALTSYQDCDVLAGVTYQYRVRSRYSFEFVDSEDPSWSDTEDDSWLMELSTWCTTGEVMVPEFWWTPVTWDAVVSGPRF